MRPGARNHDSLWLGSELFVGFILGCVRLGLATHPVQALFFQPGQLALQLGEKLRSHGPVELLSVLWLERFDRRERGEQLVVLMIIDEYLTCEVL